ncbi:GIY-YIG nuclease family protein [Candidatus Microgenomates bacterium]|nr:GIY-YIG nuclease family protein [Candidatus Microgenomates bacterium]
MYYVYILKLRDQTHYIGYSAALKERVKEHAKGTISQTKHLLPCNLVFYAAFSSKLKALQFEKYLKTNSGFAFRNKRLIER